MTILKVQGKPILRQEQLLAPPPGVFVESLPLHLTTFNSSAGPGSKIVSISSKLPLQFFHPIVLVRNQFGSYFSTEEFGSLLLNCNVQQLILVGLTFQVKVDSLMKNSILCI